MIPGLPAIPFDVAAFLILFARIGAVLMLLPAFSDTAIPAQVRLLAGLGFTAGLYALLGHKVVPVVSGTSVLPTLVISEMLVGLAMGMIVRMLFSAASMAGAIVSLQTGLSSVLVPDPSIGSQSTILSRFITVAATTTCLSMQVHHLWIASIVKSYGLFPVGGLPPAEDFARLAVQVTGQAMLLGVGLAAPLLVYGIVFNVALGLAARMAPAIQVFFITQPLNLLLGLGLLAAVIGGMLRLFAEAMGNFVQSGWSF